ncbi:pre-mRNA-splicing factor CDC5/CEF1, partial [Monoraphidium neglectum]
MPTPLVGGENPELHPTDFSGALPKPTVAATPNPLAGLATPLVGATPGAAARIGGPTPARGGGVGSIAGVAATPLGIAGATPARGGGGGGGVGATPLIRDQLGLNDADAAALGEGRGARAHARGVRAELRAGLAGLPAPQNEYAVAVPEVPEQVGPRGVGFFEREGREFEEDEEMELEEDAADTKARRAREAEARRAAEELKKSAVLRRGLPRPAALSGLPAAGAGAAAMSYREKAEHALASELLALAEHDNRRHPAAKEERGGGKRDRKRDRGATAASSAEGPPLVDYELAELGAAAELVAAEVAFVRQAMGHSDVTHEEYFEAWAAASKDAVWVPSQKRYVRGATVGAPERAEALRAEFDAVRGQMEREAHRAAKLEKKAGIVIT